MAEELYNHWLTEINDLYHDAQNFHEAHLRELANLQLRPPEGVDTYKDQQTRATICAAQTYLSQIRLVESELSKLVTLRQGITNQLPELKDLAEWSEQIDQQIKEIRQRVKALRSNRIYTVLAADSARRRE